MITAVSLNPSIDRLAEVDEFTYGGLNRIVRGRYDAGGKGLNVALVASTLGARARCIGFLHEQSAAMFEDKLRAGGTDFDFVRCAGSARTNIKLFDRKTGAITEINEPGETVDDDQQAEMTQLAHRYADSSDYMVFSGSLPPGCPDHYYRALIERVQACGCRCVLDADGAKLAEGLKAKPFLIKPNRFELELMFGRPLPEISDVLDAARKIISSGVCVVAVSLGEHGALIADSTVALYAPRIPVDVKSTVGAGDSMVAGLTVGFSRRMPIEGAFRMGVASASAMCTTEGSKIFEADVYNQMFSRVEIEQI